MKFLRRKQDIMWDEKKKDEREIEIYKNHDHRIRINDCLTIYANSIVYAKCRDEGYQN